MRSDEELCLHINRMLFDGIFIRADFVEVEWFSLWYEEG